MAQRWNITWVTVLIMTLQCLHVTGLCQYNGATMKEGTVWHPDSCQTCTCQNSIPFCEQQRCFDPKCDFQAGQILQISSNLCCPECISTNVSCKYGQKIIPEGMHWKPSRCQTCTCRNGKPFCEQEKCNTDHCPPGQVLKQLPNECCSKCFPLGRSCLFEGITYKHNEIWSPFTCTKYQCRDGQILHFATKCPQTVCKEEESLLIQDGNCCPSCIVSPCLAQNSMYQNGETWQLDSCTKCLCDEGKILCHKSNCTAKICNKGQKLITHNLECCPSCASSESSCEHEGKTYFDGDVWNESDCKFCICSKGKVHCHTSICQQPRCKKDQIPVHLPGKCCSECISNSGTCKHESVIYKNGESWKENECILCSCINGMVKCFHQECHICANGTDPVVLTGKCCPVCVKNYCAHECQSCLVNNPTQCTLCKNNHDVLENGKCKSSCSDDHFLDINGKCQICHSDCKSCFGESKSHCLSCHPGKLLKKGYCVEQCGESFYLESHECKECHPSCSSCQGNRADQCISCKLGFTLQDGSCIEQSCNDTCASCSSEGLCHSCPDNLYFLQGYCLPSCGPAYFSSPDGICLSCHPYCQNCNGSLPTQCTTCFYGKFLLHNSCVMDCGPGYFADQGAGICRACHPTCRYCVGINAADHCLSCSSGYLVPYQGTAYGQCVHSCPSKYYLTPSGTCRACHKTCYSCFGPHESECTACPKHLKLKNGHCVRNCGKGFFSDEESCFACHPSCETCYGWGSDECITCSKNSLLQLGHCYVQCELGTYLDLVENICRDCNSSCSECVASHDGFNHICTKCKNYGTYPLEDACVSTCGQGYFLNSFGFCKKCHHSCLTCDKTTANGCTSCPSDMVLAHNGQCKEKCFQGYFEADGVCHSCDYNCIHCVAEGRCEQCRDNLVLQFGECVHSCYDQFYLDHITRKCKECSWTCNTCYGPTSQECLSCMPGMFLENGSCIATCKDGYYKDGKECRACHPNCKTCSHFSTCTSCHHPYMLLDGMCIDDCGPHKFSDKRYLVCNINKNDPHFMMLHNQSLLVGTESLTSLKSLSLGVNDVDTSQKDLLFFISKEPTNGELVLHSFSGTKSILKEGHSFTIQDLNDDRVHFMYIAGKSISGEFSLKVSDQQLESSPLHFHIRVLSQQPPAIAQTQRYLVTSGSYEVISLEYLSVVDEDNIEDVVVRVVEGPQHGIFIKMPQWNPVTFFLLKDIQEKSIAYKHDGSETQHDLSVFQVWDGSNAMLYSFIIDIVPQGNQGPLIKINRPGAVQKGKMFHLTKNYLQAIDLGSYDKDIIFSLTPRFNNPRGGHLVRKMGGISAIKTDKTLLGDSQGVEEVTSFTQEDINSGNIWYQNLDPEVSSDFFKFQVSDKGHPPNVLRDQTFQMDIMPVLKDPSSSQKKFGMMVLEHHPATISTAHLSFEDLNIPPQFMLYNIIKPLDVEEGTLEHIEHPGAFVKSFTQEDINNMKVVYRPPSHNIGYKEKQVSFIFSVTDSHSSKLLYPEQTFTVSILPMNEVASFESPSVHEVVVTVNQEKLVPVGVNLPVSDHDMPIDQLEVILTTAPSHGTLIFGTDDNQVIVEEGDSFSYTSVVNDMFYIHDGSTNLNDVVVFTISGGRHTSSATLRISVIPLDKESPIAVNSTTLNVSVTEGHSVALQRVNLAYHDRHSEDSEITFTLLNQLEHGSLEILLRNGVFMELNPGNSFTQQDINNNLIRYKAQYEIGDQPVTDTVHLNVSDKVGNIQANQLFQVTVVPRFNSPPVVIIAEDMQVERGGYLPLSPKIISAIDPDTDISNLTVIIDEQPAYGFLENIRPVIGLEKSLGGLPVSSFPLQDALDSFVRYVQNNHLAVKPTNDSFIFHVTDGSSPSPSYTINILIQHINKEPPLLKIQPVEVFHGRAVVLSNSSVSVTDNDTLPEFLILTLESIPVHGTIRKLKTPNQPQHKGALLSKGQNFTYQDVLHGLIIYVHNGDKNSSDDNYIITVSDGHFTDTKMAQVVLVTSDRETPYLVKNKGLELQAGSSAFITSEVLRATDVDSDDEMLQFIIISDPIFGYLSLQKEPKVSSNSVSVKAFFQKDINEGRVSFIHKSKEPSGIASFNFHVSDPKGNMLLDQKFIISILEDITPPSVVANTGINVNEGSSHPITPVHLAATDIDSNPDTLIFVIINSPAEGHIAFISRPKKPISKFLQSDLSSGKIAYFHTSDTENKFDSFTFNVSDGKNAVMQMFSINILSVDDSLPFVMVNKMKVQEGTRKIITEFELMAVDLDTKDNSITFTIVQRPENGVIEILSTPDGYISTNAFTMEDINNNLVSYRHTVPNTIQDNFLFKVFDGSNPYYVIEKNGKNITLDDPSVFVIEILPVDDGMPILTTNLGIQYLVLINNEAMNIISKKELLTEDSDTLPHQLLYTVVKQPKHGHLQLITSPRKPVQHFTQENIDKGELYYKLTEDNINVTSDIFVFNIQDSKPNILKDNIFHIQWARISFSRSVFKVKEVDGIVKVNVKRTGNMKQYSIIQCSTKPGTAKAASVSGKSGNQDFIPYVGQVQFEEWEEEKYCIININDDTLFEGAEHFSVELSNPTYALLGSPVITSIIIDDAEDEPSISFETRVIHVNESTTHAITTLIRTGDLTQLVSVICYTNPLTAKGSSITGLESGSDYRTRPHSDASRIVFPSRVQKSTCDIKIIDDSIFEEKEEFEVILSDPSFNAKLVNITKVLVIIDGPNDESFVFFGHDTVSLSEDTGEVELEVLREGVDLSQPTTVWCGTRPSEPRSAEPGQDYLSTSVQVLFKPGQISSVCPVIILDDVSSPQMEGNETFIVYLSTPLGSSLKSPNKTTVIISDTGSDIPVMEFSVEEMIAKETDGTVDVLVLRSGDLTKQSSVLCYTQQDTALVEEDFIERPNDDVSRLIFMPGEKKKSCLVSVLDDHLYEDHEHFLLHLGKPEADSQGTAAIGNKKVALITLVNPEDETTVQLEMSAYSAEEPSQPDLPVIVNINIMRSGDVSQASHIRVSTRDGSATSGIDYHAKSKMVIFQPTEIKQLFKVEVLYNREREWHKTFAVVLGPDDPINAVIGNISVATITIIDYQTSGSGVLPAPPIVISLLHYDDVEVGADISPSPGYPLICVSPCDPHYPQYSTTGIICKEAGINQTSLHFSWEVSVPTDVNGSRPPFETVKDTTIFTSVHHKVLESVYFSRRFFVRCVAQPQDSSGNLGVPLRSAIVTIGTDNAICQSAVTAGQSPLSLQSQSLVATLRYINSSDSNHANRLHIRVEIPHQDGMFPLISTFPLHNIRFLLTQPIYRQQHVCSNLFIPVDSDTGTNYGFLDLAAVKDKQLLGPGFNRPYQFDPRVRQEEALILYRHLDLKSCIWTFDAFYHMTELIDLCGGTVLSDFKGRDSGQTYVTIQLPLYVSYIYAAAPTGWTSLEHRTEMEFSFFYNTLLWRTGLETDSILRATLQVLRILIGKDGQLIIDLKTQAKFRGLFVMGHHTLPDVKSRLIPPDNVVITFDLELVWGEETFDGPSQLWRATSNYNLKDYTGQYVMELIPCTVKSTQPYISTPDLPFPCTAHPPQRFQLPLAFQQTNRPVPVIYSLNTIFQLLNNKNMFLMDPSDTNSNFQDMDYKGTFSKGQTVYGRVLWSPDQDLESAYKLRLERLFICTGRNGFVPTFDPMGEDYKEGPQFGCIQPNKNLKHRFLILDRNHPEAVDYAFHDIPFEAKFVSDDPEFSDMENMPGVDGFLMKVDALYKVDSGHQWYLQVMYTIGPAFDKHRGRRSVTFGDGENLPYISQVHSLGKNNDVDVRNGTNIRTLLLDPPKHNELFDKRTESEGNTNWLLPFLCVLLLIFGVISVIVVWWCYFRKQKPEDENKSNLRRALKNFCEKDTCENLAANNKVSCLPTVLNSQTPVFGRARVKTINVTIHNNLGKQTSNMNGTEV